ncbi:hypothetical protein [Alteromonas macleodii]|jgi:hypothetical protein|uniref:hypothetical protein n=1 Tax=Alteromonas macleodii TaxID=28108 RepID=UPI0031408A5B|tara:strand:- start:13320 stop:13802 length:483 start_codon:yes stop_codon:yes gene_type:complete
MSASLPSNTSVDNTLYHVVTYSGRGDNRRIEFTDKGLAVACRVAFNGKFKALSGEAVRMLLQCVNESRFASHTKGFSAEAVNELTAPWQFANAGAVLYPDEFQPWEADDDVFFVQDNPEGLAGNWIVATHHAEIAAKLINQELLKLKERIRESEGLCLAA